MHPTQMKNVEKVRELENRVRTALAAKDSLSDFVKALGSRLGGGPLESWVAEASNVSAELLRKIGRNCVDQDSKGPG